LIKDSDVKHGQCSLRAGLGGIKYTICSSSSLNVFDDDAVLLLFKFWTFSIVSFLNHNVSRDGSSLETWFKNKEMMEKSPKFKK
jgi:hypothetical protein